MIFARTGHPVRLNAAEQARRHYGFARSRANSVDPDVPANFYRDMKRIPSLVCVLWLGHAALGDTISLDAAADTTISDGGLNGAGGSDGTMITGETAHGAHARGLIRFDLSSIPSGSVINSASVSVTVARNHFGVTVNHNLHRLLQDWTEGGAAWNNSGLASWTNGGNFVASLDATTPIGSFGSITFTSTQLLSTALMWYTNSASNHGWVFRDSDESSPGAAIRWFTRESGSGPSLAIDFTPPPPPPPSPVTLANLRVDSGNFVFDFAVEPGTSYTIQYKDSVDASGWNTLTTFPDPEANTVLTFSDPLGATQRFYQVVSP